jgi:hypothetical protein
LGNHRNLLVQTLARNVIHRGRYVASE